MSASSRCGRGLAAIAALLGILVIAPAADARDIELVSSERLSPRLEESILRTSAVDNAPTDPFDLASTGTDLGQTGVRVLLPEGYDQHPERRYPVLYLLHGTSDNYRVWTQFGQAEELTERPSIHGISLPQVVRLPQRDGREPPRAGDRGRLDGRRGNDDLRLARA